MSRNGKKFKATNTQEQTSSSSSSSSTMNQSDLPGFYYDPVKKRYFRVQENNFGIASTITNDWLKNKQADVKVKQTSDRQTKSGAHLIDFLFKQQLNGYSESLKSDYDEIVLNKFKLKPFLSFYFLNNEKLKNVQLINATGHQSYMLFNYGTKYRVIKLNVNPLDVDYSLQRKEIDYENMNTHLVDGDVFSPSEHADVTLLPAYVHNGQYLVTTNLEHNIVDRRLYQCRIGKLSFLQQNGENYLYDQTVKMFRFKHAISSTCLNFNSTKCAVGFPYFAQVNSLHDDSLVKLETRNSDVFCLKFKSDSTDFLFAGCSNKFTYTYDLRESSRKSVLQFLHKSGVNCIEVNKSDSNYFFSSDYTGEVSLWDLRYSKSRVNYFYSDVSFNNRSYFCLNDAGDYLYTVPKDGHVRIFNVKTNQIKRTVLSPVNKSYHDTYAEIPGIFLLNNFRMLYSINHTIKIFDC